MDKINCNFPNGQTDNMEIPLEGEWIHLDNILQINGLSHGVGTCPPQQGACKLTLNVKNGIVEEALIETIGCSGMTQSATIASEIIVGKNILSLLNTHLVCDAINVAMKQIFLQYVYGRTQTAFSINGIKNDSCSEELNKGQTSYVGTVISSKNNKIKILETADGYILDIALDENQHVIGYKYLNVGKMMQDFQMGMTIDFNNYIKTYARYSEGVNFINPREK